MNRTRAVGAFLVRLPALSMIVVLRGYQLVLSPMLGPTCRYAPSCSSYAVTAIRERGAITGCWLAGRRLLRCHPWAAGGWDPVPPDPRPRARAENQGERPRRTSPTQTPTAADTTRTP